MDLVHAVFFQLFSDDTGGAVFGKAKFGMRVQILEDRRQLICAFGNTG